MSRAQAQRAGRIIELRARVVNRIEMELAHLVARTAQVTESLRVARERWHVAASEPATPWCSSVDMVDAHDYRLGLTRHIEALVVEARKAHAEEEGCRKRLSVAKADAKKIEMWRDRLLAAATAEEVAQERKATDEVAARIARTA